jgi:hypothetical protein
MNNKSWRMVDLFKYALLIVATLATVGGIYSIYKLTGTVSVVVADGYMERSMVEKNIVSKICQKLGYKIAFTNKSFDVALADQYARVLIGGFTYSPNIIQSKKEYVIYDPNPVKFSVIRRKLFPTEGKFELNDYLVDNGKLIVERFSHIENYLKKKNFKNIDSFNDLVSMKNLMMDGKSYLIVEEDRAPAILKYLKDLNVESLQLDEKSMDEKFYYCFLFPKDSQLAEKFKSFIKNNGVEMEKLLPRSAVQPKRPVSQPSKPQNPQNNPVKKSIIIPKTDKDVGMVVSQNQLPERKIISNINPVGEKNINIQESIIINNPVGEKNINIQESIIPKDIGQTHVEKSKSIVKSELLNESEFNKLLEEKSDKNVLEEKLDKKVEGVENKEVPVKDDKNNISMAEPKIESDSIVKPDIINGSEIIEDNRITKFIDKSKEKKFPKGEGDILYKIIGMNKEDKNGDGNKEEGDKDK